MLIGDDLMPALQAWLVEHLEPICVADPKVLGDYVIALLKKNEPREHLVKTCVDELEDFLRDSTSSFVRSLFELLKEDKNGKVTLKMENRRQRTPDDDDDDRDHKHRRGERERERERAGRRRDDSYDNKRRRESDEGRRPPVSPYEPNAKMSRTSDSRDRDRERTDDRSRRRDPRDYEQERARDARPPAAATPPAAALTRAEPAAAAPPASGPTRDTPRFVERVDKSIEERLNQPLGSLVRRRQDPPPPFPPPPHLLPGFPLPMGPNGAFVPPVLLPGGLPVVPLPVPMQPKTRRCEDYDTKGYCERGALCPFDHGYDFISTDAAALDTMRNKSSSSSGDSYDPENPQPSAPAAAKPAGAHIPRVFPPPGLRPPVVIPPQLVGVQHPQLWRGPPMPINIGALQHQLSQLPGQPPAGGRPSDHESIGRGMFQDRPQLSQQLVDRGQRLEGRVDRPDGRPDSSEGERNQDFRPPRSYEQRERGPPFKQRRIIRPPRIEGDKAGDGKPAEGGEKSATPAEQYDRNTLMVKNVPPELCTIDKFNEYFKKYGNIVNIQVKPEQKMGIIQYQQRFEAQAAIRDPEAVFGNRFIRIHWANQPDKGSSAPAKPFIREGDSHNYRRVVEAKADATKPALSPKEIQKKKDELRREQIATLTKLLDSMSKLKNVDPAEKAALKKRIVDLTNSVSTSIKEAASATSPVPAVSPSVPRANSPAGGTPTTERLQKRLDSLKKIADSMGIDSAQALAPSPETARRGSARRGRGGAYAAAYASRMGNSLDLRPTTLRVSGAPKEAAAELRAHFEQHGDVLSYTPPGLADDGSEVPAVVQFAVRWQAESAMAYAKTFQSKPLKLTWTENPKPTPAAPSGAASGTASLSSSSADVGASGAAPGSAPSDAMDTAQAPGAEQDALAGGGEEAHEEGADGEAGEFDEDDPEAYVEEAYGEEEPLDDSLMLEITEEQLAAVGVDPADTVFEVSEDDSDDADMDAEGHAAGPEAADHDGNQQ